ncbi:MAG TPA: coenzyme F420-0:L-glutamate ligase [Candidatus Dormibacteraeota bacterium]|nr:coenzyme F420-0:L-glutamate ligase [Candidatus Dormibacteraeota bacterium]
MTVSITPLAGLPMIRPGDDLAALLLASIERAGLAAADGDILVVCQKIVSKAENRLVDLATVTASPFAEHIAAATQGKDARVIEVILRETRRIVRMDNGNLIVETGPGWVCANAGVDESNSGADGVVVLLPVDPDASARRIADAVRERSGRRVAVVVTDTFGRPWRQGLVDFALGVAGMPALLDLRGSADLDGRELHHTVNAHADALAAAAGLVMRKGAGIPAALVRGYPFTPGDGSGRELIREKQFDLFR